MVVVGGVSPGTGESESQCSMLGLGLGYLPRL